MAAAGFESRVVGLTVDGQDVDFIHIYRKGNDTFVPAKELMQACSVRGTVNGEVVTLTTPGGDVTAPVEDFVWIDGRFYVTGEFISDVLRAQWTFVEARYSLDIFLPWWRNDADSEREPDTARVEFRPFPLAVSQSRIDYTTRVVDDEFTERYDALLRGRLLGGTWRGEFAREEDGRVTGEDYYWTRDFARTQVLLGNRPVSINPLVAPEDSVGAQILFNSAGLSHDPWQDRSRDQYVRRLGLSSAEIEGQSQPGAIAELRVNERVIERVRVRLDGSYRFENAVPTSDRFQKVQVYVLDQRSYVVLEVQDFSQTPSDLLLDRGQLVSFAGVGTSDNPLDRHRGEDRTSSAVMQGLVRYGVLDRLTAELGWQQGAQADYLVFGLSAGIGKNWVLSGSVADGDPSVSEVTGSGPDYALDLTGRGEAWQFDLQMHDRGLPYFPLEEGAQMGDRELRTVNMRFERFVTDRFAVGAYGRQVTHPQSQVEFLLPGASWRFAQRNFVRLWPDAQGDYVLDLRTHHRDRDWLQLQAQADAASAEYRWYGSQLFELYGRVEHDKQRGELGELGAIFYPRVADDRSFLRAGVLGSSGGVGYRLLWDTPILPGFYSSLEVRDLKDDPEYREGFYAALTLSLDLAFVGGRPIPARNTYSSHRMGAMAGKLEVAGGAGQGLSGVQRITLQLNGKTYRAQVNGRHYHLAQLPPGRYRVRLDGENLPLHLNPDKRDYWVEVAEAATTRVDFLLYPEYGVMGRLLDASGNAVRGAAVTAEAESMGNARSASAVSDEYGYFRVAGLPPGDYRITAASSPRRVVQTTVKVTDSFVFDVNLTLPLEVARSD